MGQKMLMKGNEAIAEAAIQAGCRFFFGYPITPSCRRKVKLPPSTWCTAPRAPAPG